MNNLNAQNKLYFEDKLVLQDEINLKHILSILTRKKRFISKFVLVGTIFGIILAFTSRKTWQGEFQIVIENKTGISSIMNSPLLNQLGESDLLSGFDIGNNDSIKTEVGILKSPSLLMDIFIYVKEYKSEKNDNSMVRTRFKKWRKKQLDIKLQKNTKILNLTYKDKDKSLVLPVLNKISNAYQEYSDKNRVRGNELAIDYFEDQISIYEKKSIESFKKAQQFAIDQDLPLVLISPMISTTDNIESTKGSNSKINITENIRLEAASELRVVEELINTLNDSALDLEKISLFALSLPKFNQKESNSLLKNIEFLDFQLIKAKEIYKNNDRRIIQLNNQKNINLRLLKKQLEEALFAKKIALQAKLSSAKREEGVLVEHSLLLSEAGRDKATLESLEAGYRFTLLEDARNEDPWELITTPTLLPYPVAPKKGRLIALSLLSSFLIGSSLAIIFEKRKGLISSIVDLQSIRTWPYLDEMNINNEKSIKDSIGFLISSFESSAKEGIAFFKVGNMTNIKMDNLKIFLNKYLKDNNYIITEDLLETSKFSNIIVLVASGITSNKEINNLSNKLLLQENKILGAILIKAIF